MNNNSNIPLKTPEELIEKANDMKLKAQRAINNNLDNISNNN